MVDCRVDVGKIPIVKDVRRNAVPNTACGRKNWYRPLVLYTNDAVGRLEVPLSGALEGSFCVLRGMRKT